MTSNPKYLVSMDKENTKMGPFHIKKDKLNEEQQPKKTILGESSSTITVVGEPSSPEDSRLMKRKREMKPLSCADFSFKLNF